MTPLDQTIGLIDAANATDPTLEDGQPAALIYGQRMTVEQERLFPDASDVLRIATRGQHVERWKLARSEYPDGREGYLAWRREQGRRHGSRLAEMMEAAGYPAADCDRVGVLLRKEGLKRDPEVQALEDVICFTFLRHYFRPFAADKDPDHLLRIVQKTARKMSDGARAQALDEFDLPEPFAAAFRA